jgi:hypothetical protein
MEKIHEGGIEQIRNRNLGLYVRGAAVAQLV